jgi:serine phosphatase RsbU (regulator of sigma subunit)
VISRKRFHSRRVFVLHGLLLALVLGVAYVSGRAQYEALRDQQLDEAKSQQQVAARASSQILQQNLRVLLTSLNNSQQPRRFDEWMRRDWVKSIVLIDRQTRQIIESELGPAPDLSYALWNDSTITSTEKPQLRSVCYEGRCDLLMVVPAEDSKLVRIAVLSNERMATELSASQPRANQAIMFITDEKGVIVSSAATAEVGRRASEVITDADAAARLQTFLAAGNAASEVIEASRRRDAALLVLQPLDPLPDARWFIVILREREGEAIGLSLRPLLWQLVSSAAVLVLAVAIVLISTTISLYRGRRRIEQLRMDMLNRDLQKARRIQLNWLPAPHLNTPALEIVAENKPAAHISGDFYNWFELPPEDDDNRRKTAVVIGDVSGHGLPAAFLMATTQLIVRNTMPRLRDPGLCLTELNRQLCSLVYNGQFVTMLILVIDHDASAIEIASAGQAPPMLKRDGKAAPVPLESELVVGVDAGMEYRSHRLRVRAGDTLLLYTDGVIETMDEHDVQFGTDRLAEIAAQSPEDPEVMLKNIIQAIDTHRGGSEAEDDITLVGIRLVAVADQPDTTQNQAMAI